MECIKFDDASQLKFICEVKNSDFKLDVTQGVYKKCKYFDNYIYIIKEKINKFILFEEFGLYYYDGIEYNFCIIDGDIKYNINDDDNIFIKINENKLFLNKTFNEIDNELTNIMNNTYMKDEYSVCFMITMKYVRGYELHLKTYVDNIQTFYKNSFILIVDNNSLFLEDIEDIFKHYNDINIITNTSESKYEVGGYTFGIKWLIDNNKLNYDYYVFSQDNFIIQEKYDFNKLVYFNIQACCVVEHIEHPDPYNLYDYTKKKNILDKRNISIYSNSNCCFSCIFVIHKNKIYDLYNYIKDYIIIEKQDSVNSERTLGYFIKELEPKNFNIDGFLSEAYYCHPINNFKYFKKISQAKPNN